MRIAAIYNVFDGLELLPGSMKCLSEHVDLFIIVWQDVSNFGERMGDVVRMMTPDSFAGIDWHKVHMVKYDPNVDMGGSMNERAKRNLGLDIARQKGATHFLHVDCDEYYEDFGSAKAEYIASGARGSVVRLWTYFKLPTLRVDVPEDYYVPFLHVLESDTKSGSSSYPFWVDPTRSINESNVVLLENTWMHHFSWVRNDIGLKVRNSSAKHNIARGTMVKDWNSADVGPGFYVRDWQRNLILVDDKFGLCSTFVPQVGRPPIV